MSTRFRILGLVLLVVLTLQVGVAEECVESCDNACAWDFLPPNKLSIGPEVYYLERRREGGSKQFGVLSGVRFSYDYIKRYNLYVGSDLLYGTGTIKGHTASRSRLKSKLTDRSIEGRLGYTFQGKYCLEPSFTPYGGYGHYREANRYKSPSPLVVTFINTYGYAAFGFLSSIRPASQVTLGLNLRMRMMYHGKCSIKHDPDYNHIKILIKDKLQYRVELPLYFHLCKTDVMGEIGLVPFYESRHYGGRENFPFDFLDTKFQIWGCNLQFTCRY